MLAIFNWPLVRKNLKPKPKAGISSPLAVTWKTGEDKGHRNGAACLLSSERQFWVSLDSSDSLNSPPLPRVDSKANSRAGLSLQQNTWRAGNVPYWHFPTVCGPLYVEEMIILYDPNL